MPVHGGAAQKPNEKPTKDPEKKPEEEPEEEPEEDLEDEDVFGAWGERSLFTR